VSCSIELRSRDADVHHLLPRAMGGSDALSNLVTLCDGCHAAHHPTLAGGLARRAIEKWAIRLARWLDREGVVVERTESFGPALRLFGVERFREGQLPIVLAALSGKSILVVSPTGSGKTLCFQLPALLRDRVSVVISPLKTLMSEQVSDLLRKKIPGTFLNSDLSSREKETRLSMLSRNAFTMLYVAPERFYIRNTGERDQLANIAPSFLVVDEAHCVDQWGNDFRPEYGRLDEVRQKLGSPPVLAFTATAGKEMQDRILRSLGIPDATVFVRDVDRPNIALVRRKCAVANRAEEIAALLQLPALQGQRAMIFVPSAKVGEELKAELLKLSADIPFYHSRLGTPFDRQDLLKRFVGQSEPKVHHIICTNAFGMGLDIPDVRLVIHWQQSASVEDLLQEFGRAGRDRKPSVSVIFHEGAAGGKDVDRLKFMADKTVEGAPLDEAGKEQMLEQRHRQIDQVAHMLRAEACFRQSIRAYFGDAVVKRKRILAERILDWVFGTKAAPQRHGACCDYCDRELLKTLGVRGYITAVIDGAPKMTLGQKLVTSRAKSRA
jgi:ATP-dependent DNA helicase RecQ